MTDTHTQSVTEIQARYRRAQVLNQAAIDNSLTRNTTVYPHWVENTDCFWYLRETDSGSEYRWVNAASASNTRAFDHQALATALSQLTGKAANPQHLASCVDTLTLSAVNSLTQAPEKITVTAFGQSYLFDVKTAKCEKMPTYPDAWVLSPDGLQAAFVRDHNLWITNLSSGEERALTHDGQPCYVYAGTATVYGRQEAQTTEVQWSSDSRRLLTLVTDTRKVNPLPSLLEHIPQDGSLRPRLIYEDRRVAFPSDEHIETNVFLAIEVESGHIQPADYSACPVFYPPYRGALSSQQAWWGKDSRRAYFVERERDGLTARLLEFDTHTGQTRVLIEETADKPIALIPMSHLSTLLLPLPETDELIWYSERSGWAQLYLYDLNTGDLKRPLISNGNNEWLVRNVLHFDAASRELLIQTAGRVEGRNPYYLDIGKVNIDTGELSTVISSDHEYTVCDPRTRVFFAAPGSCGVAPSGRYIVTTRSRVDDAPVTQLLDRTGKTILLLEAADLTNLPVHWQWPEPSMVKASDGITDLYTVTFRPSDFSPDKVYPVLDCSFGSLIPVGAFSNNMTQSWIYLSAMAMAELGFIVVMVATRGTALRCKAFTDDRNATLLDCPHQDDCIAAIQQLAQRNPSMDMTRVGIGSWGSNPAAVSGLLRYPDFYQVGVAIAPLIDIRLVAQFTESILAASVPPEHDDGLRLCALAKNLKGHLLLIHGILDDVIPVAQTFRLVEALQQANKDFDLLLLPNLGHSGSNYAMRRQWDYLVKHLQQIDPPKEFLLD